LLFGALLFAQDAEMPRKLNPYLGDAETIKEGRQLYFKYSCNGCHGGTGGGGMAGAPPLIDDEWRYGSDDETLFKLIKGQIPEQIMPRFGDAIRDEEVWKLLTFIRSLYQGDPAKVNW
jgi:mono/diheme cytochrome c family protein